MLIMNENETEVYGFERSGRQKLAMAVAVAVGPFSISHIL